MSKSNLGLPFPYTIHPRDIVAIRLRLSGLTYQEIGDKLVDPKDLRGVTASRARQIVMRGHRRLEVQSDHPDHYLAQELSNYRPKMPGRRAK